MDLGTPQDLEKIGPVSKTDFRHVFFPQLQSRHQRTAVIVAFWPGFLAGPQEQAADLAGITGRASSTRVEPNRRQTSLPQLANGLADIDERRRRGAAANGGEPGRIELLSQLRRPGEQVRARIRIRPRANQIDLETQVFCSGIADLLEPIGVNQSGVIVSGGFEDRP
jgi:hypothetical protein